jgi:hypothetical protein
MSIWFRLGPFSASSRGRVGVRAGPVGMYGGGGRRRRRSSSDSSGGVLIAIFAVVVAIAFAVKYWYVSLPVLAVILVIAVAVHKDNKQKQAEADHIGAQLAAEDAKRRVAQEAAAVEQRAALAAAEERARGEWLAGAPPALHLPGRFTDNWFAAHVPGLHPGQVPVLLEELHERGWNDARIERRVRPYLLENPYYNGA